MISLLIVLGLSGVIVMLIDRDWNSWHDSLVLCHGIVVQSRLSDMDSRDVNWMLEGTGGYVELNNELYTNNLIGTRHITSRAARYILINKICNQEVS
jgi:hypothetical protein